MKEPGDELHVRQLRGRRFGTGPGDQGRRGRLRGTPGRRGEEVHAVALASCDARSTGSSPGSDGRSSRRRRSSSSASCVGAEHKSVRTALVSATGGVVAMVPEGLILLTSVAFAVGVVKPRAASHARAGAPGHRGARPRRRRLPRQDRHHHRGLDAARRRRRPRSRRTTQRQRRDAGRRRRSARRRCARRHRWADPNPNATQLALQERYPPTRPRWTATATVPFSSARKWSAVELRGPRIVGARRGRDGDRRRPRRGGPLEDRDGLPQRPACAPAGAQRRGARRASDSPTTSRPPRW